LWQIAQSEPSIVGDEDAGKIPLCHPLFSVE